MCHYNMYQLTVSFAQGVHLKLWRIKNITNYQLLETTGHRHDHGLIAIDSMLTHQLFDFFSSPKRPR